MLSLADGALVEVAGADRVVVAAAAAAADEALRPDEGFQPLAAFGFRVVALGEVLVEPREVFDWALQ